MDLDFEPESIAQSYDPYWWAKVEAGEISPDALRELSMQQWNVARELQVTMRAVKS
jgi:hypothetical protein